MRLFTKKKHAFALKTFEISKSFCETFHLLIPTNFQEFDYHKAAENCQVGAAGGVRSIKRGEFWCFKNFRSFKKFQLNSYHKKNWTEMFGPKNRRSEASQNFWLSSRKTFTITKGVSQKFLELAFQKQFE